MYNCAKAQKQLTYYKESIEYYKKSIYIAQQNNASYEKMANELKEVEILI